MPLPQQAEKMIRLAISETAHSFECEIPDDAITEMVEAIERNLQEAGLVVVPSSEFGFPMPEGPNP
jgi:hypothetical protein